MIQDDNQQTRMQYQQTTHALEESANIVGLLADLNSTDKETLQHSVKDWEWVIGELANIPVPVSLEKYHKTKLTYYSVMMNIGKVYAGQKAETELQLLTKAMLSYSQKIETMRAELNQMYELQL